MYNYYIITRGVLIFRGIICAQGKPFIQGFVFVDRCVTPTTADCQLARGHNIRVRHLSGDPENLPRVIENGYPAFKGYYFILMPEYNYWGFTPSNRRDPLSKYLLTYLTRLLALVA